MKASRKLIAQANEITARYSKWLEPIKLQDMYRELADIGITTGMLSFNQVSCEWYYNGEEVENSYFCYSVYKDPAHSEIKNEYTIYFS